MLDRRAERDSVVGSLGSERKGCDGRSVVEVHRLRRWHASARRGGVIAGLGGGRGNGERGSNEERRGVVLEREIPSDGLLLDGLFLEAVLYT